MKRNQFINLFALIFLIAGFISCRKTVDLDASNFPITGNHWQKLNTPYFGKFMDMQFLNADVGYILGANITDAGTWNILIKTNDGGNTWQSVVYTHAFTTDTTGGLAGTLGVYPFFPNTIFTGGRTLVRSTDGGKTWQKMDTINKLGTPTNIFFDASTGFCFGGSSVSKTVDSGKSWISVFRLQSLINIYQFQFTSRKTGYYYGGELLSGSSVGLMAKTTDGANSWQQLNYPFHYITAAYFTSDSVGYISYAGESFLQKTTDGGIKWQPVVQQGITRFPNAESMYFLSEKEGLLATGLGIFHTDDGGQRFTKEYGTAVTVIRNAGNNTFFAVDTARNVLRRTQ